VSDSETILVCTLRPWAHPVAANSKTKRLDIDENPRMRKKVVDLVVYGSCVDICRE